MRRLFPGRVQLDVVLLMFGFLNTTPFMKNFLGPSDFESWSSVDVFLK
jgi:hypothetical protein